MSRTTKWLIGLPLLLVALALAGAFTLQRWVHSDDFRERVQTEAGKALGVPVRLGALSVDLWPLPAVALQDVVVQSRPAVSLKRVEARPAWGALLGGRLEVASLLVKDALLPQQGIDAIVAALAARPAAAKPVAQPAPQGGPGALVLIPRRIVLDQVTWVSPKGASSTLDAIVRIDEDRLPSQLEVKVTQGSWEGVQAGLKREGERWDLALRIGGGTVQGPLTLSHGAGAWKLDGQLQTRGVEVAALTAPQRPLSGKLDADTTLSARFREPGALADALQSQTRFTVNDAQLHGLDLVRAVSTVGLSRGGETKLDTLAGQVLTQGRTVQLNSLVARSGVLSASGNVTILPSRALEGRVSVDVGSKLTGVPLVVGGTLDVPQVTLTRGAMLGAAVGTVLMPGVGTGAGAKLGDKLGDGIKGLFGR